MERRMCYFWGYGHDCILYLNNFAELDKYVDGIVDSNIVSEKEYKGIPIILPQNAKKESDFVITSSKYFKEIYNELQYKNMAKKSHVYSAHEWISKLIRERRIHLRPEKVRLDICTICQLDCAYCYMRTGNYGATGKGFLSFDQYKKFLNDNPFVKSIEISNSGEVFLNPDICKILRLSKEREIEITIGNGTNFNTVSDEVLELLVELPVRFITVSLDGASQETYSIYRRGGSFERVINNIRKLNELKRKKGSEYPRLQWQFIMMKHNEEDAFLAKKMAEELGIGIYFKFDWIHEDYEPEDRKKMEQITGLSSFNRLEYNSKHSKGWGRHMCYQMIYQPAINWDGRLLGCCMMWNDDYGVNVFEKGLEEALKSDLYMDTVETLLGAKDVDSSRDCMCKKCVLWEDLVRGNIMYL